MKMGNTRGQHFLDLWKHILEIQKSGKIDMLNPSYSYVKCALMSKDDKHCRLCMLPTLSRILYFLRYDLIGKLETNTEDSKCFFEVMGATDIFDAEYRIQQSKTGSSDEHVRSQFQTLTKHQIKQLYEIYKYDFEAFEYDYESFLELGADTIFKYKKR